MLKIPEAPLKDAWLAPNGRTVAENFTAWFGTSQMIDAQGCPQPLYHGTRADFDKFETGEWLAGLFFTQDPAYAAVMALDDETTYPEGAMVMPVYLRMTHPLDLTKGLGEETMARLQAAGLNAETLNWINDPQSEHWIAFDKSAGGQDFIDAVMEAGFDGIVFNENTHSTAVAVFSPMQVKSAVGNCGLYVGGSASLTDTDAAMALGRAHAARLALDDNAKPRFLI